MNQQDSRLLTILRSFGLMNRLETPFDYERLAKFRRFIAYIRAQQAMEVALKDAEPTQKE